MLVATDTAATVTAALERGRDAESLASSLKGETNAALLGAAIKVEIESDRDEDAKIAESNHDGRGRRVLTVLVVEATVVVAKSAVVVETISLVVLLEDTLEGADKKAVELLNRDLEESVADLELTTSDLALPDETGEDADGAVHNNGELLRPEAVRPLDKVTAPVIIDLAGDGIVDAITLTDKNIVVIVVAV